MFWLLWCVAFAQSPSPDASSIEITIAGADVGIVEFRLFSNEVGFPREHQEAAISTRLAVTAASRTLRVSVPPGRWAVMGWLDENGNGKLDKNFLGFPKEALVLSGPQPSIGSPPSFDRNAVSVAGSTSLTLSLFRPGP